MTINDERDQSIDFSDPYYSADQSILVAEDAEFELATLEDLADRPVGAQSGTTGEDVVEDQLIANEIISEGQYNSYGNYVLAVEDLLGGNIDAVVLDTPVAKTFASDRPVTVAFVYETGENYGFGIRDDATELQTGLNEGLQAVRDDGTYEEITSKWFAE